MATNTATNSLDYDPLLGRKVGDRYAIERLIGRGGVGMVYLATDMVEQRHVVVKVLAPHWAQDDDAVARFDREALRMARLDHPNVVKMFDHGHFMGRTYIVMEFIRGEPMRRYLSRRKRLPLEEFIPLASQILLGAGYVHERGIMLRDIKPPNIMLCERGPKSNHVKLLDFGLAKLIEEDQEEEITKAHVIGTAAYMSPEQIRGDKIDVRVDVYALGVLFFLMLTGEQPIAGDNDAAVLVNHVHGKPKPLVERLPRGHRIPAILIELIESCLAKDPSDRPDDASAMAESLFEFIPAKLFELPESTLKTRAPAEAYWATRLNSGPLSAAALKEDENTSAEWTRPLLRRAAKTGEAPLKLAEEALAAQQLEEQADAVPKAKAKPESRGTPMPRPKPRSPSRPAMPARSITLPPPPPFAAPPPPPAAAPPPFAASYPPLAAPSPPVAGAEPPVGEVPSDEATEDSDVAPAPSIVEAGAPLTPIAGPSTPTLQGVGPGPMPRVRSASRPKPGSATIRVTAADAREAVERLDEEYELAEEYELEDDDIDDDGRTGKRTTVPPLAPGDAEESDVVPIALDFDDLVMESERPGSTQVNPALRPEAAVATVSSEPMATEAHGVMAPAAFTGPQPRNDNGLRLGIIVAVAGLAALALGGLSAFLVFGGTETTTEPAATVAAAPPTTPPRAAPEDAERPVAPPSADEPPATVGTVEVRAREGARVEVDGEDRGQAPVELELPLGEHRVRVTAPGHYPWESTIDVTPGANGAVRAELVADPTPAVAEPQPKASRPKSGRNKSGRNKSNKTPRTTEKPAAPEPKKEEKSDVFMGSDKGDDNGIFLPVGGK